MLLKKIFSFYILFFQLVNAYSSNLQELENALTHELEWINYKTCPWKDYLPSLEKDPIYEVIIIGSGPAGMAVGVALCKEGISKFKLFGDHLSVKEQLIDMSFGIPSLAFDAWSACSSSKNPEDYLTWYQKVMQLPIENECSLIALTPLEDHFELVFEKQKTTFTIQSRTVVFASDFELKIQHPIINHKGFYFLDDRTKWNLIQEYLQDNPEIPFIDVAMIDLWSEHIDELDPEFGKYPYLGKHFEFQEKVPGCAPYLRNLYAFDQRARLSHGSQTSSSAEKLAEGIASNAFKRVYQTRAVKYP